VPVDKSPALIIDLVIGIAGFSLSVGWGKASGRKMDRGTMLFLAKLWGGIALFGMVLAFVM
jgi:hypothetical protein